MVEILTQQAGKERDFSGMQWTSLWFCMTPLQGNFKLLWKARDLQFKGRRCQGSRVPTVLSKIPQL